jgi:hypothetical protein
MSPWAIAVCRRVDRTGTAAVFKEPVSSACIVPTVVRKATAHGIAPAVEDQNRPASTTAPPPRTGAAITCAFFSHFSMSPVIAK